MTELQSSIKLGILYQQYMVLSAQNNQYRQEIKYLIDYADNLKDTVKQMIDSYPTDSRIKNLVHETNSQDRSIMNDLIAEARSMLGGKNG